jgi:hypothetical protein
MVLHMPCIVSFTCILDENGATLYVYMHVLCLLKISLLSNTVNNEKFVACIEDYGHFSMFGH